MAGDLNAWQRLHRARNRIGDVHHKVVEKVEQVSFSGRRGVMQGQDVTERCVMRLTPDGPLVTEIAPGIELRRDVLDQADTALKVAPDLKTMPATLYRPGPMGLALADGADGFSLAWE